LNYEEDRRLFLFPFPKGLIQNKIPSYQAQDSTTLRKVLLRRSNLEQYADQHEPPSVSKKKDLGQVIIPFLLSPFTRKKSQWHCTRFVT
jgi:hypothetical protein